MLLAWCIRGSGNRKEWGVGDEWLVDSDGDGDGDGAELFFFSFFLKLSCRAVGRKSEDGMCAYLT